MRLNQTRYICSMALYHLQLSVASDYKKGTGWKFGNGPVEDTPFDNPLMCNENFDSKSPDLIIMASSNSTAARLQIIRVDGLQQEIIRERLYDGENVISWFAAYQTNAATIFEERRYIQRVLYPIGYYALMHPGNQLPDLTITGCAPTTYDLMEILGDQYTTYELRT